ncbi:hypothetical protein E1301_Tti020321 [Triplophysa tibetana]|uniref:Uncharacterized protein n=1 Tax=Triplophysa tibetana TaxID=1572043 RepID=A0A5A9NPZ0_9TELE|nr:hypothetical protein E1301_Tti020321 [Triplophysa tibetana]
MNHSSNDKDPETIESIRYLRVYCDEPDEDVDSQYGLIIPGKSWWRRKIESLRGWALIGLAGQAGLQQEQSCRSDC